MKFLYISILLTVSISLKAQHDHLPLVTVTGSSILYAAPDEVHLSISIENRDESVDKVRKDNKQKTVATIAFLRSQGILDKHIQTASASIGPRYDRSGNVEHFYATQNIYICITDLHKVDAIIDQLLEMRVTRVGNPSFKTTKLIEHKANARKKAIVNAREKAAYLAQELGQDIGHAFSIKELQQNHWTPRNAYANSTESAGSGESDSQAFAPGQIEVRAEIEVSFYLK